jgi:SAM-dependent methyltransferase
MMNTTFDVYQSPQSALAATDDFYWSREGFEYPEEKVTQWVRQHVTLPKTGCVLDLCCGDGIWSKGMQNVNPKLELFGIDISAGGISRARQLLGSDEQHFVVGDAEAALPFPDDSFELIFARGPGLYNQHNMDRPATIRVIEMWHRKLAASGRMISIFASTPRLMGTYTPMEQCKLPFNRCPRKTESVDFLGGKFHHSIESFHAPFWKAQNANVVSYQFFQNLHYLVTQRK